MEEHTTTFNIRGKKFETLTANLSAISGSILAGINETSKHYNARKMEFFFDRDPDVFGCILNLLSQGKLHIPKNMCVQTFREEMQFWGIPHETVAPCCWRTFFQIDEDVGIIEELRKVYQSNFDELEGTELRYLHNDKNSVIHNTLRYKVWRLMDQPGSSCLAKVWFCFYMLTVLLSSSLLCLWTLDDLRTYHYLTNVNIHAYPSIRDSANDKMTKFILADPVLSIFILDTLCLFVFILEYILHFGTCYQKFKFIKEPLNILSLVVILIMLIAFILEFAKEHMAGNRSARLVYFICKAFTMTRLLLFFRLERHFQALRVLLMSVKASLVELLLMVVSFLIATTIFASLIYFAEIDSEDGLNNIFISMWWTIITMTTVGYGDYYPTTIPGYFVGVACALCGVMLLAMPIAVIASNFSEYYSKHKDIKRVIKNLEKQKLEK